MEKNRGCILHKHIYSSRVYGVSHQKKVFLMYDISKRVADVLLVCYEADVCIRFRFKLDYMYVITSGCAYHNKKCSVWQITDDMGTV